MARILNGKAKGILKYSNGFNRYFSEAVADLPQFGERVQNILPFVVDFNPVSYTHLDVYKRQALEIARLIEEAEQVILADIAYRMAMGEDMTDPQWRKRLLSDNEAIKRDVEALFADLDEEAAEEIDRIDVYKRQV